MVAVSAWSHQLLRRVVPGDGPAPAICASVAVVDEGVVPVVVLPAAVAGESQPLGGALLVVVAVDGPVVLGAVLAAGGAGGILPTDPLSVPDTAYGGSSGARPSTGGRCAS